MVVLACRLSDLDGSRKHYQDFFLICCPLISKRHAFDKPSAINFYEMLGIEPGAAGREARMPPLCYAARTLGQFYKFCVIDANFPTNCDSYQAEANFSNFLGLLLIQRFIQKLKLIQIIQPEIDLMGNKQQTQLLSGPQLTASLLFPPHYQGLRFR